MLTVIDTKSKALVKAYAGGVGLALVMLVLLLFVLRGTAFGQQSNGIISGTVVDLQGAVVPGATVTARNQLTTTSQTTQTNEKGDFTFPALLPGIYAVSAEKEGFQKFEKSDIHVLAGGRLDIGALQLKLGSTKSAITVTAAGTPIETTSSHMSAVVTDKEMEALPSLGRDYMALVRTLPGSTYLGQGNGSLSFFSSQAQFNGVTGFMGVSVHTDGVISSWANSGIDFTAPTMDAIQDFTVITGNFEAQYGKAMGAAINVTTKSGTTNFHGGAYYYGRNEALNANDFFSNRVGAKKSRYRYNTFGATLGGPIPLHLLRNKLFFFSSFDYEPQSTPAGPRYYLMPTALEREGDFTQSLIPGTSTPYNVLDPLTGQPFSPANIVPADRQIPIMQKVLNIFPLPNFTNTAISKGTYNYVINDSNASNLDQESLRMDYAPTDKWRIFGRWQRTYDDMSGRTMPGINAGWMTGNQGYINTGLRLELNTTYTFNPHTVNEFAIGRANWVTWIDDPQSTINEFAQKAIGVDFPQPYKTNPLNLVPAMSFSNGPSFSYNSRFPLNDYYGGWSVSDGLTYVYKNHQLKFGVYYEHGEQVQQHHGGNGAIAGAFNFSNPNPSNPFNAGNAYAEALLGYFDSYSAVTNRVLVDVTAPDLAWYAQDNWRASKNLSLNYGLRLNYDIPQALAGPDGGDLDWSLYNPSDAPPLFQPVMVNGTRMMQNPVTGEIVPPIYLGKFVPGVGNPAPGAIAKNSANWKGIFDGVGILPAPRFGFAYNLFGNGKTVIRGGFGAYYGDRTIQGYLYYPSTNPPTQFYPTQYYGNVTTFASATGLLGPTTMQYMDRKAPVPYTLQWTLAVQHEIGFGSVLGVAYVANVARHQQYAVNINTVPYGARFLAKNQDPTTGKPLPDDYFRPYPGYATLNHWIWGDNTNYNSLQVTFDRRFTRNLTYGVAYTWSKSMDDNRSTNYLPGSLTYGVSSINMPNRLTADWVWSLPKASQRWDNLFSREVLDGWQLSGIASFISGRPVSVGFSTTTGVDLTGGGDGSRVVMIGNAVLPKSKRTFSRYFNTSAFAMPAPGTIGTQWVPSLYGPGVNDWDLALTKNIRIKEGLSAQLRTGWYNAFNHTQFSSLDTSARFNPTTGQQVNTEFGQLTGDRGPRIIQLSLRLTF